MSEGTIEETIAHAAEVLTEYPVEAPPGVAPPHPVAEGGDLQIALRGYEVARFIGGRWDQIGAYRPNNLALSQARADATWLQARHPAYPVRVRPIVSLEPLLPTLEANTDIPLADGPLRLDADEGVAAEVYKERDAIRAHGSTQEGI